MAAMNQIPLPPALYLPLLLVVAVCILALLALLLVDHDVWGRAQRALLGRQVARLRMRRMLVARDVPLEDYLRLSSVAELRQDIVRCRGCVSQARCDQAQSGAGHDRAWTYCPNTWRLSRLKRRSAATCPA
jgi:hypothetical protein